jgi:hypothetical protein
MSGIVADPRSSRGFEGRRRRLFVCPKTRISIRSIKLILPDQTVASPATTELHPVRLAENVEQVWLDREGDGRCAKHDFWLLRTRSALILE